MKYWLLASMLAVPALAGVARAEGLSLGTGFDYSSGKYTGTEKTEILYVPFFARYETGPAVLKLTVPYIRITGPGNVVGAGADRVTLPGAGGPRRTESGLGDIVASAFYNVLSERSAPVGVDLGVKVKLGTADDTKGLGTGKNDYSLQADFFKTLDANTLFASLGHRWYGDPPGVNLKNVFYGSLGVTHRLSAETSAGVAYDFRPAIIAGGGRISELTAFWSQRLSRDWKLQPYALVGFGKASPDYGIGALITYSY
jgi:Putative MetA-pathway of phenol degradation